MKAAFIWSAISHYLAEGGGQNVYKIDFGLSPVAAITLLILVIILIWLALSTNTEYSDTGEAHAGHDHAGHEAHGEHVEHAAHEEIVETPARVEEVAVVEETPEPEPAPATPAPVNVKPDDLKIIEGIGPKIARVMTEAGIATFAQMAEASVEQLQAILDAAELRLADPTTWPEQARLAAAGEFEALQKYQDSLKGGRGS